MHYLVPSPRVGEVSPLAVFFSSMLFLREESGGGVTGSRKSETLIEIESFWVGFGFPSLTAGCGIAAKINFCP